MSIMGWAAVGVMAWAAAPLALVAGAVMRTGGRSAVRMPARVRHGLGCRGGRMVTGQV